MAVTHASIKKQKETPIIKKEDNPARMKMTQAEAIADNARIKAEREKVEAFRASLKKDKVEAPAQQTNVPDENQAKIAKLEAKKSGTKGPGSKEKKAEIQAEIDKLKGGTDEKIS
jgi:hypothetical protein